MSQIRIKAESSSEENDKAKREQASYADESLEKEARRTRHERRESVRNMHMLA